MNEWLVIIGGVVFFLAVNKVWNMAWDHAAISQAIRTRPFDPAEYLSTEDSISAFVMDAMQSGDPVVVKNAINTAERAYARIKAKMP